MLTPAPVHCPYCGEPVELLLDASAGAQDYIEDCPVCCRPMRVTVTLDENGTAHARVRAEHEA